MAGAMRPVDVQKARVIDMAAYLRLRADEAGAPRIAKALGVTVSTAGRIMKGEHWQQQPDRVRLFNQLRGGSIDPETGIPTGDDLAKFGGLIEGPNRHTSESEKDVFAVMRAAGVRSDKIPEVVRRITALNGGAVEKPGRFDTAMFAQMLDEKFWTALALLDDVTIASAGPRDLTQMISMLAEKRQLLRGEPTAIVRSDQRTGLDKVAALLLNEARRRGISVEREDA